VITIMKIAILVSLSILLLNQYSANAYELATHSRITLNAFGNSRLEDDKILGKLGLEQLNFIGGQDSLNQIYYVEITETGASTRFAQDFVLNKNLIPNKSENVQENLVESLSLKGWLMRGAIREDDYINDNSPVPCRTEHAPNPQDENPLNRPFNHFYDPVYDRGLSLAQKSIDWGLGTADALVDQNSEDAGRTNRYTLFDAREAMYRAVTMRAGAGTQDVAPDGSVASGPNTRYSETPAMAPRHFLLISLKGGTVCGEYKTCNAQNSF